MTSRSFGGIRSIYEDDMKYSDAYETADWLLNRLKPFCTRIEIAGSVRRKKMEVNDIEIIAIPDLTPPIIPRPEFGKPIPPRHKTRLDQFLHQMKEIDTIRFEKNGDRYKRVHLKLDKISADLFLVLPPAQWGVQMAIRTGPADFSHWIVTRQRFGGALPNGYRVQDGALYIGATPQRKPDPASLIPTPEECDFFNFLKLECVEPGNRVARWKLGS